MKNLEIKTKFHYEEEGWKHYIRRFYKGEEEVARVDYMVTVDEWEDEKVYVENVDVWEGHRNQGYGTQILKGMANEFDMVYLAPTNEDNQRLYERIGEEIRGEEYDGVDQGFCVYEINR